MKPQLVLFLDFDGGFHLPPNLPNLPIMGSKLKEAQECLTQQNYQGDILILDDQTELWFNEEKRTPKGFILCHNQFEEQEMNQIRVLFNLTSSKPKIRF